jgi:hypothetical protein
MDRPELVARTRQLIEEGERLQANPSLRGLQTWLQLSDDLLSQAWGTMDRYHLAWLMVGKPRNVVRGRPMTEQEEAAYVREVAEAKTAALRTSLDAAERQGMPFRGESGGVAPGLGMGVRRLASRSDWVGTSRRRFRRSLHRRGRCTQQTRRHKRAGPRPPTRFRSGSWRQVGHPGRRRGTPQRNAERHTECGSSPAARPRTWRRSRSTSRPVGRAHAGLGHPAGTRQWRSAIPPQYAGRRSRSRSTAATAERSDPRRSLGPRVG